MGSTNSFHLHKLQYTTYVKVLWSKVCKFRVHVDTQLVLEFYLNLNYGFEKSYFYYFLKQFWFNISERSEYSGNSSNARYQTSSLLHSITNKPLTVVMVAIWPVQVLDYSNKKKSTETNYCSATRCIESSCVSETQRVSKTLQHCCWRQSVSVHVQVPFYITSQSVEKHMFLATTM